MIVPIPWCPDSSWRARWRRIRRWTSPSPQSARAWSRAGVWRTASQRLPPGRPKCPGKSAFFLNAGTKPVLRIRIRDPVPFLPPGSGMGKKSGSRSGMNNPDHISESLETVFWVNSFMRIRDPGWSNTASNSFRCLEYFTFPCNV